jgi:hypothetical protein
MIVYMPNAVLCEIRIYKTETHTEAALVVAPAPPFALYYTLQEMSFRGSRALVGFLLTV